MRLEHYEVEISEQEFTFEFDSEGPKGRIRKMIQFSPFENENIFNLGFGDKNLETGDFDDAAVTDNGDTEEVLSTVAHVTYLFSESLYGIWIYATGSTPARTRLYRIGINKYYPLIAKDFYILGQRTDDEWETFQKDKNYQAFMVARKERKFEV